MHTLASIFIRKFYLQYDSMSCHRTILYDFFLNLVSSFLFRINIKDDVATYADIVPLPLLMTLNRLLLFFEDGFFWKNFRGDILVFLITKLISCMHFSTEKEDRDLYILYFHR